MASIEFIKDRLQKAQDKVTKKQGTFDKKTAMIAKKTTQLEKMGYTVEEAYRLNPNDSRSDKAWTLADSVHWAQDDVERLSKEITEAQEAVQKWEAELKKAQIKADSRNVKPILDFLQMWKQMNHDFFMKAMVAEAEAWKELRAKEMEKSGISFLDPEWDRIEAEKKVLRDAYDVKRYGTFEKKTYTDRWGRSREKEVKVRDGEWEYAEQYINHGVPFEDNVARLDRDLQNEADRKYDFIIERTCEIVGTITDASLLRVGAKDDLNGLIKGTDGEAYVQTIGAGGYNIQCYHFRTLINRV